MARGYGEGSIYKRESDGLWVGVVSLGRDESGKRVRKVIYAETRKKVADDLITILAEHKKGLVSKPGRKTTVQYLGEWLAAIKETVKPRSWLFYEQHVRVHIAPHIGHVPVTRLTPVQIQDLYTALLKEKTRYGKKRSPSTVRHTHSTLNAALGAAVEWQIIAVNPCARTKPPRVARKEQRFLEWKDAQHLTACLVNESLGALYLTALATGMRQGELLGLRWDSIDFDACEISVTQTVSYPEQSGGVPLFQPLPKKDKQRLVSAPDKILALVKANRVKQKEQRLAAGSVWQDHGLVWTRADGAPLRKEFVTRDLQRILDDLGIKRMRFHDLRHSAGSLLLNLGYSLKDVADILGHEDERELMKRYAHVLKGTKKEAARKLGDKLFG